ncbi:hypothetical protein [Algivirga pacifica]|uniref:Tetratricopeptide repeat-containing protein n=1 Tax=Algivirga pacifica TaxID=1162670 RepID=A0ABP9DJS1_9BACT
MKLTKFNSVVEALYPHEVEYLNQLQQFQDKDRQAIFERILYNHRSVEQLSYDQEVDKRKYSAMISWIHTNLEKIDVDFFFEWLLKIEQGVNMDVVSQEDSVKLLGYLKQINATSYHFIKFYELVISYRDYILIRNMTQIYSQVKEYLQQYRKSYLEAKKTNERLNNATIDIIEQHKSQEITSIHWESFLMKTAKSKDLDGFTRYKAWVRLSYLYYNYKEYKKLEEVLRIFEEELKNTTNFYSPRILANHYNNKAMLYSKTHQYALAEQYAYYSIRKENPDYLLYVNNLCFVLLRQHKDKEAMQLMNGIDKQIKDTATMYNFIGYVALYLKTLSHNGFRKKALQLAQVYVESHRKEIFEYRWHIFFSTYFKILLLEEQYTKIISLEKKYKLVEREQKHLITGRFTPKILFYHLIARYAEGKIGEQELRQQLINAVDHFKKTDSSVYLITRLLGELQDFHSELIMEVRGRLGAY